MAKIFTGYNARKRLALCLTILMVFMYFVATITSDIVLQNYNEYIASTVVTTDLSTNVNEIVEIKTAHDFFLMTDSYYAGATFRLKNDIDFTSDTSWYQDVPDYQYGWRPLDSMSMAGSVLDGLGHALQLPFYYNQQSEYIGLFGKNAIDIKNLSINANISTGTATNVSAGIVSAENYGRLDNVHTAGYIETEFSSNYVGGLVGVNYGILDNCSFNGGVWGQIVGGLVGKNESLSVSNSYAYGSAHGHIVGGLIGGLYNQFGNSKVWSCYSLMDLERISYDTTTSRIGDFIATREANVEIESCYTTDVWTPIALGETSGVTTLSSEELYEPSNYVGFDFDNHWSTRSYGNARIPINPKMGAISSDSVFVNGSIVEVVGEYEYYDMEDWCKLSLNIVSNIGIKSALIDGEDQYMFEDGTLEPQMSGYAVAFGVIVVRSLLVEFELQYLLTVDIISGKSIVTLNKDSGYYAPNTPIIITAQKPDFWHKSRLVTTFNGKPIDFVNTDNNKWRVELDLESYELDDILLIECYHDFRIEFIVVGAVGLLLVIVICVLTTIKRNKSKKGGEYVSKN